MAAVYRVAVQHKDISVPRSQQLCYLDASEIRVIFISLNGTSMYLTQHKRQPTMRVCLECLGSVPVHTCVGDGCARLDRNWERGRMVFVTREQPKPDCFVHLFPRRSHRVCAAEKQKVHLVVQDPTSKEMQSMGKH